MTDNSTKVQAITIPDDRDRDAGDVADLVASIAAVGLLHPIVVTPDKTLVAGLRRLTAVRELGWGSVPVTVVTGLDDAAVGLRAELDENTCRRDLTVVEAAYARTRRAEALRPLVNKGGRPRNDNMETGRNLRSVSPGKVDVIAAVGLGYSARTIDKVDDIIELATNPETATEVRETATRALEDMDKPGSNVSKCVKQVRRVQRDSQLPAPPPPSDLDDHDLILTDPPWRYEHSKTDSRKIENQYPTMTLDEIKDLEPPAANNCILYLWATSPKLTEAIEVMEAWGFTYRTCMVWVKDRAGMGYWARQQHELILIGVRGKPKPPDEDLRPDSVIEAPRGVHSAKPVAVHELIEAAYPHLTKVEMFARSSRPGWNTWGNQS